MNGVVIECLTVGQVIVLLTLYAMCVWIAYMGARVSGCAFAFIGTMLAEPWTLRWPRDDHA